MDTRSKRMPFSKVSFQLPKSGKKFKKNSLSSERIKNRNIYSPITIFLEQKKKASFCILKKASLTVEAVLVIPVFLMMMVCIISINGVYANTLKKMAVLRDRAEQAALIASVTDEELWITYPENAVYKPFYIPSALGGINIQCVGKVRAWNGRRKSDDDSDVDDHTYVYITETGAVYHTSSECTHLNLSIRAVSQGEIGHLRNQNKGRYHACEKCIGNSQRADTLYITDDGDRFHNSISCSGLKRTVKMVDIEDVSDMRECSRCRQLRQQ